MEELTDNQQGKVDIDLAWLGGFLDGEGSFVVVQLVGTRRQALDRPYIAPRIVLVNTDQPTLEVVLRILERHHLPYHVSQRIGKPGCQDSWDVRVQGMKRCQRWLNLLTPYLYTKRSQAEVMLALIESRLANSDKRSGYSDEEYRLIEQLRKRPYYPHRLHARTA